LKASDPYQHHSDEELLAAFRASHDNRWLGALLQRYTLLLLGVAMKYLKDKDEARDAVQQIFLKAITHLPQGEILNFKGWLYILMRNHCLQILRDKTYKAPEEVLHQLQSSPLMPDREEIMLQDYTLAQLQEAMLELNDAQRACVDRFYLQRQSYQQIMEATGYSFKEVKSHIQNGKRNLKNLLIKKLSGRI
jgi:RNA polymerase sigma factor (sigma-70 family)